MSLPRWLDQLISQHPCKDCDPPELDARCVTFVGCARAEKPFPPRAMLLVEYQCPGCKTVYRIHEARPIEHIVAAVESFGRYNDEFLLSAPDGDLPDDVEAEQILNQKASTSGNHAGTGGISDEEVSRFLKRLQRTSFKPQSKSFRGWLRQFGIDPDAPPGSPDSPEPPEDRGTDDLPDEPSSEPPF